MTCSPWRCNDDGTGPALFAGGSFDSSGGTSANHIAKWNGATWRNVGGGMSHRVYALAVYDDGAGPALYAGGNFTIAGGTIARKVAKWDGTTWSALGSGIVGDVEVMVVHDDGTGPALFVGGNFGAAGGTSVLRMAKWNGTTWSALGSGMNEHVRSLAMYDDGTGPALFAGGFFTTAGGLSANKIAKWNGATWSALGSGLDLTVSALAVYDNGTGEGPTLCAGGTFGASPGGDSFLARWGGCSLLVGVPYCFGDGGGTACPCGNSGAAGQGCANSTGMGAVLAGHGTSNVAADDLAFTAQHLRPGQAALLFAGTDAVNSGNGVVFGDGLRCAAGSVTRLGLRIPDAAGAADWGPGLGASGGWAAGDTRHFQVWYRDPGSSPCATGFNLSNGYTVALTN